MLIAAQHCSYPGLLPADIKETVGTAEFDDKVARLMQLLHY
jgi:hypothetical protein